jgi:PTH1 family peptidyl-tRNA hydrolase
LKPDRYTRCEIFDALWQGHRVVLARGRSYMNESGGPVKSLASYFNVPVERTLIVHDELDIPFGALRVKQGGGDGGHNGLRSIRKVLGTGDTIRIRVGIGRPPGRQDPADYVLKAFAAGQRDELALLIERADDAIECVIEDGVPVAQNRFNAE